MKGDAFLRTNLGRAGVRRSEIVKAVEECAPILHTDWHDLPMVELGGGKFVLRVPLTEVGTFFAKGYFLPHESEEPEWLPGENVRIKVEPASNVSGNTVYCAFVRQFGDLDNRAAVREEDFQGLDDDGFTIIPPSGKFRNLIGRLDFIVGELGCRIIQLLPIHPTPTTYAKMGLFGSPFASLDFMDVDPALAEFDRRTTPLDQFRELVGAVHRRHARIFMDIPVDHTGWASWLQIHHKDWFARSADQSFRSPGAWGVTWGDLSKLDYNQRELWTYIAEVFLHWCRVGVDGFRCDAGYMVPLPAWEYITAKVRIQFPDTTFLLEGLGGPLETTEALLCDGGLNWAYSELFQNYTLDQIDRYLPHSIRSTVESGLHIHFAETHDNDRLASRSREFALMRTALCALLSQEGGFGITNGVEWFAAEKIRVHEANPLNWGAVPNQVEHISKLTAIIERHPAFHPGAQIGLVHLSREETLALRRQGPGGEILLILVNLCLHSPRQVSWAASDYPSLENFDLLARKTVVVETSSHGHELILGPGEVLCLTPLDGSKEVVGSLEPKPFAPVERSVQQRMKVLGLELWAGHARHGEPPNDPLALAARFVADPERVCAEVGGRRLAELTRVGLHEDLRRVVMVPPGHGVFVTRVEYFHGALVRGGRVVRKAEAMPTPQGDWFLWIPPQPAGKEGYEATLELSLHGRHETTEASASLLYLPELPEPSEQKVRCSLPAGELQCSTHAILSNRLGAISQVRGRWGEVESLYDALLAGNLDPERPVDRWVMLTRLRGWVVWRDFSTKLDHNLMMEFGATPEGPVEWRFDLPCGMGKRFKLNIELHLCPDHNLVKIVCERPLSRGEIAALEDSELVRIIFRPDIDDRVNHAATKAFMGSQKSWPGALSFFDEGFRFAPAEGRDLKVYCEQGAFTPEPEWTYNVEHPFEEGRGLESLSDHFSPGYFTLTLQGGQSAQIVALIEDGKKSGDSSGKTSGGFYRSMDTRSFPNVLTLSMGGFVVRREGAKSVIAGYPWFLDWGRDTLIFLRGMVKTGRAQEALEVALKFASFERGGTLPNMLAGADTTNRSTTDAPLWLFAVCSELADLLGEGIFEEDCGGRSLAQVLSSIADHYSTRTESGVSMDPESGLIWSPSHHTWMDTNHPAGTPRQGYPVEIQALWSYALKLQSKLDPEGQWREMAKRVKASLVQHFARGPCGGLSDCLHGPKGTSASEASADDACRPNQLLAITLGAIDERQLCEEILSQCARLLVPGAIRSLADREVSHPQPVRLDGRLLNDPHRPYWGRYEGPENTQRKPAYHNGTAWVWPMPLYCEALFNVYGEEARKEALAILSSTIKLIEEGCLGHLPEVLDGDAPHAQRGCGAQAWSASETLRVYRLLISAKKDV